LDKTGGGSTDPMLGQGRGKDQCSDTRNQAETKDHTNPRTSQRNIRDEEDVGKTYHCANKKKSVRLK
jgi:hypothetical protein